MNRPAMRRALAAAGIVGAWAVGLVPTAGGQGMARREEPVMALVQLQFGRLVQATVEVVRNGDKALLPISTFFDLAEIRQERIANGDVMVILQPGNRRVAIVPDAGTIRVDSQRLIAPADELVRLGDEVYLDSQLLGQLLGVRVTVAWNELTVTVINPDLLPLGRRVNRERLRRAWSSGSGAVEPDLEIPLDRNGIQGVALDYSAIATTSRLGDGAYTAGLGVGVLGGSFSLDLASQGGGGTRTDAAWLGVWRTSRYVTQLQVGDATATGPNPRSSRGFSVTNAPYFRAPGIGNIPFSGALGPGWQIEAYRGGRLVAYDSVNAVGRFSIDVPIVYGENPVDFVAYGPFGEIREFNQTYRVRTDQLPPHRFEYGLSVGACRTSRCDVTTNADLRYGITPRWSLRGGIDHFSRDSLGDLVHPYLSLTGGIGNGWTVHGEAVGNAVLRASLGYEPSVDLRISGEFTRFARGVEDPILTPDRRLRQWTLQSFFRPYAKWGNVYLDATFDRIEDVALTSTSGRIGLSGQVANTRILPAVRAERVTTPTGPAVTRTALTLNTFTLPQPALGALLGQVTARTVFESQGLHALNTASVFFSRPITRTLRAEAGLGWQRQTGTTFSFIFSTELPGFRSVNTATEDRSGTRGTHFVQGSLQVRGTEAVDFATNPSVERAGVAGRVFLDLNGNGRFDADEEAVPGVRVRAGFYSSRATARGEYRIWDLTPYEPVLVTIDSLSIPNPLWVPVHVALSVEAAPNSYRAVDLPLAPAGVIDGRVLREGIAGLEGAGGITVRLRHQATGESITMVTFGDGAFYQMGVRPGTYDLFIDPAALDRLHLTAETQVVTVHASRDGDVISGLEVVMRR